MFEDIAAECSRGLDPRSGVLLQFFGDIKCRARHTYGTRIGCFTHQSNRRARHAKTDGNLGAGRYEIEETAQDLTDIAVVLVSRVVPHRLAQQAAADADKNALSRGVNHALF